MRSASHAVKTAAAMIASCSSTSLPKALSSNGCSTPLLRLMAE